MLRRILSLFRRSEEVRSTEPLTPRDYAQERADRRDAQMSDEDKAWGEASRQRDRENRERNQPPPA